MSKNQIIGLVVAAVVFVFVAVTSAITNSVMKSINFMDVLSEGSIYPVTGDYIGVVHVKGTMLETTTTTPFETLQYDHQRILNSIEEMKNSGNNKGLLLYVDSGGGGIYESEELHHKLMEYRNATARPVYVYMGRYAASGGYYVSAASDGRIYANMNTLTGSIGVITSYLNLYELFEEHGIKYVSITSGEHKDMLGLAKEELEGDNAVMQAVIDEMYERFVEVVAEGRGMSVSDVKKIADGRILTAKQALEADLIDGIMTYEELKELITEEWGGAVTIFEPEVELSLFASMFATANQLRTKSDAQAIIEAFEKRGNGVIMYYAQLS
ncbi:MAG: signal peptide peptidase SppA [Oscillospiraceae bacterium]|nr:signal peptide peptidase SppA [Oscillospiraceae bacterium]